MSENKNKALIAWSKSNKQFGASGVRPCRSHPAPKKGLEECRKKTEQESKCKMKSTGMHAGLRKRRKVPAKLQTVTSFQ